LANCSGSSTLRRKEGVSSKMNYTAGSNGISVCSESLRSPE
jgi:hypothetical protein